MRLIFFIFLFFSILSTSCSSQNIDFKTASNSKQVSFPAGKDKKCKALKELSKYKEDNVCDSLYKIYNSIDTTIKGYGEYYDVIFYSLVEINTQKSAETIGKIYQTNQPKFVFQSSLINLSNLKYYEKLFPGILNNLKPNLMNAHFILEILLKGIKENKISKDKLILFLPTLESFYEYSKLQRDLPISKDGYILNIYYWISNPVLAKCLNSINNNEKANKILNEILDFSNKASTKEEKKISWEAYKALNKVENTNNYLSNLCKDIVYRKEVFEYLTEKNKIKNFPNELNNQISLSEMISVSGRNLRLHDTNWPENVSYSGTKQINSENYYFYQICWWKDCKSNSIVVVGLQPSDKTKFESDPKMKGEIVKENIDKKDIPEIIKNYKLE
jgi:hypothetical protein